MNETDPSPSPDQSEEGRADQDSASPRRRGGFAALRLKLLVGMLVVALMCLGWDYFVARQGSQQSYDRLLEQATQRLASNTGGRMSDEDVRELLGRDPTVEFVWEGKPVEAFDWQGGLPKRKYTVYVVYDQTDSGRKFSSATYLKSPHEQLAAQESQDAGGDSRPDDGGPAPGPANPPGISPPVISPPDITLGSEGDGVGGDQRPQPDQSDGAPAT